MGNQVNGKSSILAATKVICRMVGKYGIGGFQAGTSPAFAAAVLALVAACNVYETIDQYPGEIDGVLPDGPEDNAGGL